MSTDIGHLRAQIEILRWAKTKKAEIAELEHNAKETIQAAIGDDDTGTIDGADTVTWKTHKRRSLDQSYIKNHYPDVYAEAQTVSEIRRFEVCD